jgi:hypothetical protein
MAKKKKKSLSEMLREFSKRYCGSGSGHAGKGLNGPP